MIETNANDRCINVQKMDLWEEEPTDYPVVRAYIYVIRLTNHVTRVWQVLVYLEPVRNSEVLLSPLSSSSSSSLPSLSSLLFTSLFYLAMYMNQYRYTVGSKGKVVLV
jgi:hypothetical protein